MNVTITTGSVSNVLVVPVDALLAQSGGAYAVEVAGANGARHLVTVTLGLFDDCRRPGAGERVGAGGRPACGGAEAVTAATSTEHRPGLLDPSRLDDEHPRPVLEVDQVTKVYPSEPPVIALRDVSFTVARGELVGIVGPVGVGQDHSLAADGHLGPAQRRPGADHRPRRRAALRPGAGRAAGHPDRLRVPAVLLGRAPECARQRGRRPPLRRGPPSRTAGPCPRRPRAGRPG